MKTRMIEQCICVAKETDDDTADAARAELEALEAELTRIRALLASGQVVDLARVDSLELVLGPHGVVMHPDHVREAAAKGNELRAWLIEKAGVKA